ncbi:outer dense fiber protein 4 isoform 2, partial [Daubentonia madagascariensis]
WEQRTLGVSSLNQAEKGPNIGGLERNGRPGKQGWDGITFIFSTLLLFPINLWIFELEGNLSIPIGWSYFIGWLVFVLYVTCAILCHFNHKSFWSLILNHPSGAVSCSSNASSVQESLSEQTITDSSLTQEGVLGGEQKNAHP